MNLKIIGYETRYKGEGNKEWRFSRAHPGPLPQGHAAREIRPVYADTDAATEKQKVVPVRYAGACPYDDPTF